MSQEESSRLAFPGAASLYFISVPYSVYLSLPAAQTGLALLSVRLRNRFLSGVVDSGLHIFDVVPESFEISKFLAHHNRRRPDPFVEFHLVSGF